MATNDILTIDGGVLEGGGQILRNAATLCCILSKPIHVKNIRAGRSTPGLRPQHLTGLQLIESLSHGKLVGGSVGSTEVTLNPSNIIAGSYLADTKTAGSICLLMQAALPCLLYGNQSSTLTLKGGTNADMAPQVDYCTMVFKRISEQFGMKFDCHVKRRGYYPKGGGEVCITVHPTKCLTAVDLTDFGELKQIYGRAFVAGVLPIKVAQIMARSASDNLRYKYGPVPLNIEVVKEPEHAAVGTATGIIIVAETSTGCLLAGSALGKRGVPAEKVGEEAAVELLKNLASAGCVDEHLQDQLILLMALAKGKSTVKCGPLTLHTQTAIHVAEQMTDVKFQVKKLTEGLCEISCDGIGFQNTNL